MKLLTSLLLSLFAVQVAAADLKVLSTNALTDVISEERAQSLRTAQTRVDAPPVAPRPDADDGFRGLVEAPVGLGLRPPGADARDGRRDVPAVLRHVARSVHPVLRPQDVAGMSSRADFVSSVSRADHRSDVERFSAPPNGFSIPGVVRPYLERWWPDRALQCLDDNTDIWHEILHSS